MQSTLHAWRRRAHIGLALSFTLLALGALPGCGGGGGDTSAQVIPSTAQVTVSGVLTMVETAAVDSDTNDDNQAHWAANDDFDTAQALVAPVHVVGSVNLPNKGEFGPNFRRGDPQDGFVLQLEADQTVELEFAADTNVNDIDLYVLDEQQKAVGESTDYGNYECVRISKPGKYYVVVDAFEGATVYNLRIGSPGSAPNCANATGDPIPAALNRLIALPEGRASALGAPHGQAARPSAAQLVQLAGLRMASVPSGAPTLITLPDNPIERAAGLQTLRGRLGLSADSPADTAAAAPAAPAGSWLAGRRQLVAYGKTLQRSGSFRYVAPDHAVRLNALVQPFPPNDPWYGDQRWHYEQINLPSAMSRLLSLPTAPALRPIVAVIDSGIVLDHPDFTGQLVPGRTFFSTTPNNPNGNANSANPDDPTTAFNQAQSAGFHGTHVAGTIAARTWDQTGAAGVAPMAQIMPLRVFDPDRPTSSAYDIVNAMLYAAGLPNDSGSLPARRADVINMSLGSNQACPSFYQEVIRQVRQAGVIVVAAAGNDAHNDRGTPVAVGSPANCPGAVSVGALNVYRRQTPYSQSGPGLTLAAPGGDYTTSSTGTGVPDLITSTLAAFSTSGRRTPSIGTMAGTSMATPHVAGVMALMKYVHPGLTPADVDAWINAGQLTDDVDATGRDSATGMGLINARKAVDRALQAAGGGTGSGTVPAPPGELIASPFSLDFGTGRDSLSFSLLTTASTDEVVKAINVSSPMLKVNALQTDAAGLGSYQVQVDRSSLLSGTSAFPTVTVRTSKRTLTIEVTVVKGAVGNPGGAARMPDYGQVYVLAMDADTGDLIDDDLSTLGISASNGVYRWQFRATAGRKVLLVAGADLDQNGYICEGGEPCGAFPLLTSQPTPVTVSAGMGSLTFALAPMGTGDVNVRGLAPDSGQIALHRWRRAGARPHRGTQPLGE